MSSVLSDPGCRQVIGREIPAYLGALDTHEVQAFLPGLGYRAFTDDALLSTGALLDR